jgi:cytochrome c-type biogenesis protein CcmH/NrfG
MLGFIPIIALLIIGSVIIVIALILNNKKPIKTFTNKGLQMGQYDDIAKLADLKEKGLITEEEFTQQKKKILSQDFIEESIIENKQANSFTFKAVVFFVLGLIVPLWPISLPLFWYLAYKHYKAGN